MRKLKRAVAKNNMKKAGLTKICKNGWFRLHWRKYVNPKRLGR